MLLQHRLRWTGHAVHRSAINPESPINWHMKHGGQLKIWTTALLENLTFFSGPGIYCLRRWNRDYMAIGIVRTTGLVQRQGWTWLLHDYRRNRSQVNVVPRTSFIIRHGKLTVNQYITHLSSELIRREGENAQLVSIFGMQLLQLSVVSLGVVSVGGHVHH